ncbi:hypothetical protein AB0G80_34450, partial [Streptomyces asoensis]
QCVCNASTAPGAGTGAPPGRSGQGGHDAGREETAAHRSAELLRRSGEDMTGAFAAARVALESAARELAATVERLDRTVTGLPRALESSAADGAERIGWAYDQAVVALAATLREDVRTVSGELAGHVVQLRELSRLREDTEREAGDRSAHTARELRVAVEEFHSVLHDVAGLLRDATDTLARPRPAPPTTDVPPTTPAEPAVPAVPASAGPTTGSTTPTADGPTATPATPTADGPTAAPATSPSDSPAPAPATPAADGPTAAPAAPASDGPASVPATPAADGPTAAPAEPAAPAAPGDSLDGVADGTRAAGPRHTRPEGPAPVDAYPVGTAGAGEERR